MWWNDAETRYGARRNRDDWDEEDDLYDDVDDEEEDDWDEEDDSDWDEEDDSEWDDEEDDINWDEDDEDWDDEDEDDDEDWDDEDQPFPPWKLFLAETDPEKVGVSFFLLKTS